MRQLLGWQVEQLRSQVGAQWRRESGQAPARFAVALRAALLAQPGGKLLALFRQSLPR